MNRVCEIKCPQERRFCWLYIYRHHTQPIWLIRTPSINIFVVRFGAKKITHIWYMEPRPKAKQQNPPQREITGRSLLKMCVFYR